MLKSAISFTEILSLSKVKGSHSMYNTKSPLQMKAAIEKMETRSMIDN